MFQINSPAMTYSEIMFFVSGAWHWQVETQHPAAWLQDKLADRSTCPGCGLHQHHPVGGSTVVPDGHVHVCQFIIAALLCVWTAWRYSTDFVLCVCVDCVEIFNRLCFVCVDCVEIFNRLCFVCVGLHADIQQTLFCVCGLRGDIQHT